MKRNNFKISKGQMSNSHCSQTKERRSKAITKINVPSDMKWEYEDNIFKVGIDYLKREGTMQYCYNPCSARDPCGRCDNLLSPCGEHDRAIGFNIQNVSKILEFKLTQVDFRSYLWIKVNDATVYVGPENGSGIKTHTNWGYCAGVGMPGRDVQNRGIGNDWYCEKCERNTDWHKDLDVDLIPYLNKGQNTIWMRIIVGYQGGHGSITINAKQKLDKQNIENEKEIKKADQKVENQKEINVQPQEQEDSLREELRSDVDMKEYHMKFETKFKSDQCFKIFKFIDLQMCLENTEIQIISPTRLTSYDDENLRIVPTSWTIKIANCLTTLHDLLKTCTGEFKIKKFLPCNGSSIIRKIDGDIEQLNIDTQITTFFKSHECFVEFAKQNMKICFGKTETLVVSSEQLDQCNGDDFCIAPAVWSITRSGCVQEQEFFEVCIGEFEAKGLMPCKLESDIKQYISGNILEE